jgi:type II secretion system protein H
MMLGTKNKGFTLIEVLVVLAIVAITLAIISPSARVISANKEADALKEELRLDLMFARNQAITAGTAVTISPIGGDWNIGWNVIDNSNNSIRVRGGNSSPMAESGRITSTDFTTATPVRFDQRGRASRNGEILVSVPECSGLNRFRIQINQIGQVVILEEACN